MNQSGPTLTAFELLSDFQQMKVLEFTSVTNMQDLEKATQFIRCFNFDVNVISLPLCRFLSLTNDTRWQHRLFSKAKIQHLFKIIYPHLELSHTVRILSVALYKNEYQELRRIFGSL